MIYTTYLWNGTALYVEHDGHGGFNVIRDEGFNTANKVEFNSGKIETCVKYIDRQWAEDQYNHMA